MSMISQETINEIRSNVDIVDIISGYISLTPKGKNYFGVCPFHDDHAPSMSVSKEKQIYTCFSCGATGNVYKFLMDYENISFIESIRMLAPKAGITIDIKDYSKPKQNNNLYEMYDLATKLYQNNINTSKGKEAKYYLKNRKITDSEIKQFQIGLSLKEDNTLENLLRSKKYSNQDMLKSGLVINNEYGFRDIYKNRIMFPLSDINGQVVGFSGRIYNGEDTSKYVNTKETEIFKKGLMLYNYKNAKEFARTSNTIIVMEGFMDVIRAYTIGVKNVVASMGTAITKEQALLLKKMAKNVILCFDGDSAGEKATFACANELLKIGVSPLIVRLEDELDPDDYILKNGESAFKSKLENPINVMDFKFKFYKKHYNLSDSVEMSKYVNDIIKEINQIEDDVLREISIQKISQESNLTEEFIKSKLENKTPTKVIKKEVKITNKYVEAEQKLLYYMLKNKEIIKMFNKNAAYFPTDEYRFLFHEINCFYQEFKYIDVADFITYINDSEDLIKLVGEIESLKLKEECDLEEIADYIKVIKSYTVEKEMARLKEALTNETDNTKKQKIANQIVELYRSEKNDRGN